MPPSNRTNPEALPDAAVADERVRTVMLLIQEDGYSKTAVEKTASSVYLSVSRLSHLFKECIGLSPTQYARFLKLQEAKHLIEDSQRRIKEVAAVVGYNDVKRFIHDFKSAYGMTPRQHRKRGAAWGAARSDGNGPLEPNPASSSGEHLAHDGRSSAGEQHSDSCLRLAKSAHK